MQQCVSLAQYNTLTVPGKWQPVMKTATCDVNAAESSTGLVSNSKRKSGHLGTGAHGEGTGEQVQDYPCATGAAMFTIPTQPYTY